MEPHHLLESFQKGSDKGKDGHLDGDFDGSSFVDGGRGGGLSVEIGQQVFAVGSAHHSDVLGSRLPHIHGVLQLDILQQEQQALERVVLPQRAVLARAATTTGQWGRVRRTRRDSQATRESDH